jgi:hypothetical protein
MYTDNIPTSQREQIINTRISNRNIPSQLLEPLLSFYPKSTKYIQQPIIDSRNTPSKKYEMYTDQVFNPGSKSPWQGFVNAINIESELKNQLFPLSYSDKNTYVPKSNSDLYNYPSVSTKYTLINDSGLRNQTNVTQSIFNNYTRYQLKDGNRLF